MSADGNAAEPIGMIGSVGIAVVPRDAVTADVAVAIAGMFTREANAAGPVGGLRHLDEAMGGALLRLRSDGIFHAGAGETLTLSAPAAPVRAESVVLVGLGDIASWSPAVLRGAVAAAAREAQRLGAVSVAFAPSLLDSGLAGARLDGVPAAMLAGLRDALAAGGDSGPLASWLFCTGAAHLDATLADFRRAFASPPRD